MNMPSILATSKLILSTLISSKLTTYSNISPHSPNSIMTLNLSAAANHDLQIAHHAAKFNSYQFNELNNSCLPIENNRLDFIIADLSITTGFNVDTFIRHAAQLLTVNGQFMLAVFHHNSRVLLNEHDKDISNESISTDDSIITILKNINLIHYQCIRIPLLEIPPDCIDCDIFIITHSLSPQMIDKFLIYNPTEIEEVNNSFIHETADNSQTEVEVKEYPEKEHDENEAESEEIETTDNDHEVEVESHNERSEEAEKNESEHEDTPELDNHSEEKTESEGKEAEEESAKEEHDDEADSKPENAETEQEDQPEEAEETEAKEAKEAQESSDEIENEADSEDEEEEDKSDEDEQEMEESNQEDPESDHENEQESHAESGEKHEEHEEHVEPSPEKIEPMEHYEDSNHTQDAHDKIAELTHHIDQHKEKLAIQAVQLSKYQTTSTAILEQLSTKNLSREERKTKITELKEYNDQHKKILSKYITATIQHKEYLNSLIAAHEKTLEKKAALTSHPQKLIEQHKNIIANNALEIQKNIDAVENVERFNE